MSRKHRGRGPGRTDISQPRHTADLAILKLAYQRAHSFAERLASQLAVRLCLAPPRQNHPAIRYLRDESPQVEQGPILQAADEILPACQNPD